MKGMSVIGLVLHYRDAELTARCLKSLFDEGISHVLVWDNTGDEGRSASELVKVVEDSSRVTVVGLGHNLGFAAGVNKGLAFIARRWPDTAVLLINNDAVLLSGGLRALQSVLASNPKAHVVYPSIDHGGWVRGSTYYHRLTGLISDRPLLGSFIYPSGCCLLINLPVTGVPLYDEDFFMYGEDIALGARLSPMPGAMQLVTHVLVRHSGAASSGQATPFYEFHVNLAHLRLARKLARSRLHLLMLILGRAVVLPLRALSRCVRYRSLVPASSLLRALLYRGDITAREGDISNSSS